MERLPAGLWLQKSKATTRTSASRQETGKGYIPQPLSLPFCPLLVSVIGQTRRGQAAQVLLGVSLLGGRAEQRNERLEKELNAKQLPDIWVSSVSGLAEPVRP